LPPPPPPPLLLPPPPPPLLLPPPPPAPRPARPDAPVLLAAWPDGRSLALRIKPWMKMTLRPSSDQLMMLCSV